MGLLSGIFNKHSAITTFFFVAAAMISLRIGFPPAAGVFALAALGSLGFAVGGALKSKKPEASSRPSSDEGSSPAEKPLSYDTKPLSYDTEPVLCEKETFPRPN